MLCYVMLCYVMLSYVKMMEIVLASMLLEGRGGQGFKTCIMSLYCMKTRY